MKILKSTIEYYKNASRTSKVFFWLWVCVIIKDIVVFVLGVTK